MKYDYLIIGSGLFGSVFAHEMNEKGKRCLVIERRNHVGGNIYTQKSENIQVHKYGAHIFHTDNKKIWEYINKFSDFNRYTNSPLANHRGKLYNLPFNMNTFYQLWGVRSPQEAIDIINTQKNKYLGSEPSNLEEQALQLVGEDIYVKLIKGYTEKQWGRKATELPPFIIKRLPLRFTFDNNYFYDSYQGIPIGGYTNIIEKMLNGIEVRLGTDYFKNREYFDSLAKATLYTGAIDQYFDYCLGALEYRSLKFETEILSLSNFQGNAVVNYTEYEIPYTRIIEHQHFEFGCHPHTIITKEYPCTWRVGEDAYYPVNDPTNQRLFDQYTEKAKIIPNVIFGGRLAEYKYYDMHQVILSSLKAVHNEIQKGR